MNPPRPPSNASHYMPYVVLVFLVALAAVGTHYFFGKASSAPNAKQSKAEIKQSPAPPVDKEPVLGFELPAKSYIGTIGKERGLKAVVYGRKADLTTILASPSLGLRLGSASAEGVPPIDPLSAMNSSQEQSPSSVKPRHVLVVFANSKQFLKLIEETRDSVSKGTSPVGKGSLVVDPRGDVEVSIGLSDGVELDATSLEKLNVSYPDGALRVSAPS